MTGHQQMAKQYEVLARKWRPQQFDDVVGQQHVTTTLKNAIQKNRLAHAYLFVGPRGIGKTSIARILAKALNCVKGPTITPCDTCDSCKEITAGNSLDVLEIDGASNRGIDEVRGLRETVRYAPARGRFKIYIIDEVHMLTKEAFNALLKTLEEPPSHVKFIFATTEPQKILPTILSRCQRFDLSRIPAGEIVKHLKIIAKDEKVSIDEKALSAIARGAEGGLRDAESTLDQLIAFCGNEISEDDVLSVFGLVAHDKLGELTDTIIDGRTNSALTIVQELDHIGKDLQRLLADLLEHFRNLLVVTLGGENVGQLNLAEPEIELLRSQSKRIDSDAVLQVIDSLAAAEGRLRYALSKRIFFEIAIVKAIKARQALGIDAIIKKLGELKNQLGGAGNVSIRSEPVSLVSEKAASYNAGTPSAVSFEEAWQYAVEHLGKVTPLAKTYLVGTRPLGFKDGVFTVGFDPEFADRREFVDTAKNKDLLQTKLKEKLRVEVLIKFEVSDATAAPAAAKLDMTKNAGKNLEQFGDDPLIRQALEIFKGRIVDVRK
jgi:DNA polymerase-3 subunit gamma/tau